ncbi:signal peptidase I [Caldiplasma sukawensis]
MIEETYLLPRVIYALGIAQYPTPLVVLLTQVIIFSPSAFLYLSFFMYVTYRSPGIKRTLLFLLSYNLLLSEILIGFSSTEIYLILTIYIVLLTLFTLLSKSIFSWFHSKKGIKMVVIRGMSMFPVLEPNDICFIKMRGSGIDFLNGDIIEYIPPVRIQFRSEHVIHRIIRKEGDTIITKGDNNPYEDGQIKWDNVVGKALAKISSRDGNLTFLSSNKAEIQTFSNIFLNKSGECKRLITPRELYLVELLPYLLAIITMLFIYI